MEKPGTKRCRVAIVGAQRARVEKVASLISSEEITIPPSCLVQTDVNSVEYADNGHSLSTPSIVVEYLPCVATFDSYENESGETIRYLASLEYHGPEGKQTRGSSLAPFFDGGADDNDDAVDDKHQKFPGIAAVAVGCGIHSAADVSAIETLVTSLGTAGEADSETMRVIVETINPNPEYGTMKDENDAYRSLDAQGKAEAARQCSIGPGKMAKFAVSLATKVVHAAYPEMKQQNLNDKTENERKPDEIECDPRLETPVEDEKLIENNAVHTEITGLDKGVHDTPSLNEVDPTRPRYACRRCRTILFGEGDLEDPPHGRAIHGFTKRKAHSTQSFNAGCASLFLASGIAWMGDMRAVEGKFTCPKCVSKLGGWKWAGTQCSCGTWVTPAIQVTSSKVDVIAPVRDDFPAGTIVTSIAQLMTSSNNM